MSEKKHKSYQSLVDQMRSRESARKAIPFRKPETASKPIVSTAARRFTWTENVVASETQRQKKTDFERGEAGAAPRPAALGAQAPINLPKARAQIAEAREKKKELP